MFYPGQLVYIPEQQQIGIYLAFEESKKWNEPHICFVYCLVGEDGSDSDTFLFSPDELLQISKDDKKSLTGQTRYVGTYERTSLSDMYSDKEAPEFEQKFIAEMLKVANLKWVKAKYKISTDIKSKSSTVDYTVD
jgi:hypothetical protein